MILLSLGSIKLATGAEPTFTNCRVQGLGATMVWQAGTPPFLLQRKATLQDPTWFNVLTTSKRSVSVARDISSGFFRLQSQTTNLALPFTVLLSGTNEIPANASTAIGVGTFSLERSNFTYSVTFSGLSSKATAGHIHGGATPTNNAAMLMSFGVPAVTSGTISGTAILTADQVALLINGMLYVNIHSVSFPGGEIRGQIVPLRVAMNLDGASEVPLVETTARASGWLTMIGSQLNYQIDYSQLHGDATAAHIHGAASTTNAAAVLITLPRPTGTSGTIAGSLMLTPVQLYLVLSGQTYMNIHSTGFPGGEIRGHISPTQLGVLMNGASEIGPTTSAGAASGLFAINQSVLTYRTSFTNLTAAAIASHIHGPADATHNAAILFSFTVPAAASGTFSGQVNLSALNLFYLVSGLTYADIHSGAFPGGEIRGQIMPRN